MTMKVTKIIEYLSQGAQSISSSIWDTSKPDISSRLLSLKCELHQEVHVKSFNTATKAFTCEVCESEQALFSSDLLKGGKIIPVEQLLGYIEKEYSLLKRKSIETGLPLTRFEEFMQHKEVFGHQGEQRLLTQQKQVISRLEKMRSEFNKLVDSQKVQLQELHDREVKQFAQNAKFVCSKLESFVKELAELASLPTAIELSQEVKRLKADNAIHQMVKEHAQKLDRLSKLFDPKAKTNLFQKEQIASSLLRTLVKQSSCLPCLTQDLSFAETADERPLECLTNYVDICLQSENITEPFRMSGSLDNMANVLALHESNVLEKGGSSESDDYFYISTPTDLHYLHYYDSNRQTILALGLQSTIQLQTPDQPFEEITRGLEFFEVALPKDVKLAPLAKTITTPRGDIYFVGGLRSKSMYHLVPKQDPCITVQKADMTCEKYGMGLLYVEPGVIYSIGGVQRREGELVPTGQCERYFVHENRWEQIDFLQLPASQPGVCLYANRYIYKFGGYNTEDGHPNNLIEEFDLLTSKWKELRIMNFGDVNLLPKSLVWQVDDERLLVLGGNRRFMPTGEVFAFNLKERWEMDKLQEEEDFSDVLIPMQKIPSLEGYEIVCHVAEGKKLYVLAVFQKMGRLEKKVLVFDRDYFSTSY